MTEGHAVRHARLAGREAEKKDTMKTEIAREIETLNRDELLKAARQLERIARIMRRRAVFSDLSAPHISPHFAPPGPTPLRPEWN